MKTKRLVAKTLKIIIASPVVGFITVIYLYFMALPLLLVFEIIYPKDPLMAFFYGLSMIWSLIAWGLTVSVLYGIVDDWEKK